MEDTGYWYNLAPVKYDGRKNAKDLRIRNLVNLACNGGLHIKIAMKELYNEYCDYPSSPTVDILDCLGYGVGILKPHRIVKIEEPIGGPFVLKNILKELEERKPTGSGYPIAPQHDAFIKESDDGKWRI